MITAKSSSKKSQTASKPPIAPRTVNLTDMMVRNFKPPAIGQVMHYDTSMTGFGVRVSQGGTKTFYLVHGRDRQRVAIGKYPDISLAQARFEAKRLMAEFTLGKRQMPVIPFDKALTEYLEVTAFVNKARTMAENTRLLRRHFHFKKSVADITSQEISRVVDRLLGTPTEANHAFTAIRTFFNWCVRRHYITHSPMQGMRLPARTQSRSRVLTTPEIKSVYLASDELGTFGTLVKLCILTGQRRGEIGALKWDYIDRKKRTITLPAGTTKNGRAHTFPITSATVELIASLPKVSDYLFPGRNTDNEFRGWAKSKKRLDTTIESMGDVIAPWTLHDLRRTYATNLAALSTPPHVVERILNHASGTISGVAAIYNQFQYMDEMRAAMEFWEKQLAKIVGD